MIQRKSRESGTRLLKKKIKINNNTQKQQKQS